MNKFQIGPDTFISTSHGINHIGKLYSILQEKGPQALESCKVAGFYDKKTCGDTIIDIVPIEVERIELVFGRNFYGSNGKSERLYDVKKIVGVDQMFVVLHDNEKLGGPPLPEYVKADELDEGDNLMGFSGAGLKIHTVENIGVGLCYDIITKNNIPSIFDENCLLLSTQEDEREYKRFFMKRM